MTVLLALAFAAPSHADEAALRAIIAKFATAKGFPATEAIVRELAATGDTSVERPLAALAEGNLYFRKSDSAVFIGTEAGQAVKLADPLTGAEAGEEPKAALTKVKVNNGLQAHDPRPARHADPGIRRSSGPARRRRDDVPQPGSGGDTRPRRRDRQGNCRQRQGGSGAGTCFRRPVVRPARGGKTRGDRSHRRARRP